MTSRAPSNPGAATRRRLVALVVGWVLGVMALLLRLWHLQVIKGEWFAAHSASNRLRLLPPGV